MTGTFHLRRAAVVAAFAALLHLFATNAAMADKRVALVIGNSAYKNVSNLPNPAKDAAAIGTMLTKAGFDVVDAREDVPVADMKRMIRDFSDKVRDADVAVVFYAGHGIEVDGTNYLIPVDARLERDIDVEDETVSLDRIVRILDPAKKLRLVILDACRDNPFDRSMKRSLSSRGVEKGLAKVEPSNPNTLIAYAAKAGSTASDGAGNNSPFTTALLRQLTVPGQDLRKSLGYVRDDVMKATGNKQEPFVYGSLGGDDVTLVPALQTAAAVPAQVAALDPNSQLRRDYELAAAVNTAAAWDAFITNYPKGFYADLARAARAKLDSASASKPAESRNPQQSRDAGSMAGFDNYVGRSFTLHFLEGQQEVTPSPGFKQAQREIVAYVKSPEEIASSAAYLRKNPLFKPRFALGALGEFNRGIQVTYSQGQLKQLILAGSHRVMTSITSLGSTCQASVLYELMPGKDHFELRNVRGEPVNISALTSEAVSCKVSKGDAVGAPPTADASPGAKAK
jgi:uncharacterized caspase-like protein